MFQEQTNITSCHEMYHQDNDCCKEIHEKVVLYYDELCNKNENIKQNNKENIIKLICFKMSVEGSKVGFKFILDNKIFINKFLLFKNDGIDDYECFDLDSIKITKSQRKKLKKYAKSINLKKYEIRKYMVIINDH